MRNAVYLDTLRNSVRYINSTIARRSDTVPYAPHRLVDGDHPHPSG